MKAEIKLVEIARFGAFWALRHIQVEPEQRQFTKNIILTFLQTRHPAVTTYRIDAAGKAIGYVMLIHAEKPTQWIIERLTIDRGHQRQGYAYAVTDMLIDMVHGFENSEMVIARYAPENEAARQLFHRLNFVEQDNLFRGRHIAVLEFEFEEDETDEEDEADEDSEDWDDADEEWDDEDEDDWDDEDEDELDDEDDDDDSSTDYPPRSPRR